MMQDKLTIGSYLSNGHEEYIFSYINRRKTNIEHVIK